MCQAQITVYIRLITIQLLVVLGVTSYSPGSEIEY